MLPGYEAWALKVFRASAGEGSGGPVVSAEPLETSQTPTHAARARSPPRPAAREVPMSAPLRSACRSCG